MPISISYLQAYIKANDHVPEKRDRYFMKLVEETGELSRAIRKDALRAEDGGVKGTIGEELWDVIYYALALANCYDIDMEAVIPQKEALNNKKYGDKTPFIPDM